MATKANNTSGSIGISSFGSNLSNPSTNTDNIYSGNWSNLGFGTVRYELNNYTAKIYFYNINTVDMQNYALTALFTFNYNQTYRPSCTYNGVVYSNCGAGNNLQKGWVHDAAGGYEWWMQSNSGSGDIGSGNFNNNAGAYARIFVK